MNRIIEISSFQYQGPKTDDPRFKNSNRKYVVWITTKPIIFSKVQEEKKVFDELVDGLTYAEELKQKYGYDIIPCHGGYIYNKKSYLKYIKENKK